MKIQSAGEAWENALDNAKTKLTKEDIEILKGLAKMLGKTDLDGQVSEIRLTEKFIDTKIKEAEFEKSNFLLVGPYLNWNAAGIIIALGYGVSCHAGVYGAVISVARTAQKGSSMKPILIVSGHTDLQDSVANKAILSDLKKALPDAEFDYLDSLYPDFQIDVAAEQAKLVHADIIVLQFPLFWYAMPSLLCRWMEETFVHGFAHGSKGKALQGKKLVASFTAGAPAFCYNRQEGAAFDVEDYLAPLKSSCALCGLEFVGFVFTPGVSYADRTVPEKLANMKALAAQHAERLIALIATLQS